jgi:outer membrane protein, heavy metal efflux system
MIKMKLKTTAVVIAALGFAATGGIALNEQGPRGTETEGYRVPLEPLHPLPDIGQLERDSAAQMAIRSARDPEEEDAARRGATTPRTPVTMTLDDAIERVVRESLDLRSKFLEIPLARADILTAGLRNHPKRYTDGQIVPYGRYIKSRHGDPTNYDINISHPVDYLLKRQAHILDASRPKRVIEVQYQDAVRLLIGEVYTRFLDVQAAQEKVRRAGETSLEFRRLLGVTVAQAMKGIRSQRETDRVKAVCETAGSHFDAATSELERTKRALGALLKLSAKEAGLLEGVESLDVQPVALPAVDELVRLGLATRPDLAAFRLGLQRAQADLALQRAVRVPDAQILYQPFGIQDKTPSGSMSPMPWALGLIVPLPVYTKSAARARLNADQTGAQLTAMERQVTSEVMLAHRECEKSLAEVRKIEHQVLPCARKVRDETARGYDDELLTAEALLKALQDFRDVECRYIDLLTRLRRNTFDLNTAVANRIMP